MRLNPNCVRDILLTVEEKTDYETSMCYEKENNNYPRLQKYSHEEIVYHISQCSKAGLIDEPMFADGGDYADIPDLTPKGHEFIENVRNDNNWNKVLSIADKLGSKSLIVIADIAAKVIAELLKSQCQMP